MENITLQQMAARLAEGIEAINSINESLRAINKTLSKIGK